MGSEMCIRDRRRVDLLVDAVQQHGQKARRVREVEGKDLIGGRDPQHASAAEILKAIAVSTKADNDPGR